MTSARFLLGWKSGTRPSHWVTGLIEMKWVFKQYFLKKSFSHNSHSYGLWNCREILFRDLLSGFHNQRTLHNIRIYKLCYFCGMFVNGASESKFGQTFCHKSYICEFYCCHELILNEFLNFPSSQRFFHKIRIYMLLYFHELSSHVFPNHPFGKTLFHTWRNSKIWYLHELL